MDNLISKIESLLFISGRPMSGRELSELLKVELAEVEIAADKLLEMRKEASAGISIIKSGNSFQMVTSPANAALIQEFVKDETTGELSRPSLETLTIIAYRGPVSKTDLDRIRGVNCGMILHNLLMRGLIDDREDKKKNEIYYTATFDFLKFLGLSRLEDLPDYERLHKDDTIDRILADDGQEETVENSGFVVNEAIESPLVTKEMTEEQKEVVFEEALAEIASTEPVSGSVDNEEMEEDEFDFEDDEDEDDEEGDEEDNEETEDNIFSEDDKKQDN